MNFSNRLFILFLLSFISIVAVHAQEQDFTIMNGQVTLPGTLTLAGDKNAPVVVMVHGSGPNDRDETIGPNKFFKQLAEGFAKEGISSLRYDKRTLLYKDGADSITFKEETVDDAVKAVRQLKADGFSHIFVAGHSLGGHCIPLIAKEVGDIIDGVIILSGNTGTLEASIDAQLRYIGEKQGAPEAMIKQAKEQMMSALPEKYIQFDKQYNALSAAKEVAKTYPDLRWMVAQGGHDYQVTMADFTMWKMNLMMKATYYLGETLDHIYRSLPEMATPNDYMTEGTVDENAIKAIAEFIKKA